MNIFEKIIVPGDAKLTAATQVKLGEYSRSHISFPKTHFSESAIINVAHDADAIIVPWHTPITKAVLGACPKLKYIGATSTTLKGIDLPEAQRRGVTVTNISRYGNRFVAKFIFGQLANIDQKLSGKTLGVVGPGAVGQEVATAGAHHNMQVQYSGPTRKPVLEAQGAKYLSLPNLLKTSNVISLHTPRDIQILGYEEFKLIRSGTTLVDTAVGDTIDDEAFREWISGQNNHAIFDLSIGKERFALYQKLPNVIAIPAIAGFTPESNEVRCEKILENIERYLNQQPV